MKKLAYSEAVDLKNIIFSDSESMDVNTIQTLNLEN